MVHKIYFCEDPNSSSAKRVNMPCKLECLWVHNIDIGRGNGENDAVRLGDVFWDEISGLLLDICRLISNRYLPTVSIPVPSCHRMNYNNTFVKPGRSTSVKLRTCGEYILRLMGDRLIPLLLPAILAVSFSISRFTSWKSVNLRFGIWWNSAHSGCVATLAAVWGSEELSSPGTLISCRMSGLRVTIPLPRGRKSRPTIFSRTEDLPEDCEPTTT